MTCVAITADLLMCVCVCVREFKQQSLLLQGKGLPGGWHCCGFVEVASAIMRALLVVVVLDE